MEQTCDPETRAAVWISCRVEPALKAKLAQIAAANHRTPSDQLRHMIAEASS